MNTSLSSGSTVGMPSGASEFAMSTAWAPCVADWTRAVSSVITGSSFALQGAGGFI